jgi:alkanesulfonate monooxygenase SsuD/methylene tetrahydromethanopterin reductase-like flavin-dependent oxidoreductase (luciferase family)
MNYLDGTLDVRKSALLGSPNRLKLAVFCANVQRGTTHSKAPGTLRITWDDVSRIARAVDASGIEAIIPLAQWKKLDFDGAEGERVLEPFTWAAGIAAITQRVQILSTCHIPLYHPVKAAKIGATIDLISGGRFGLNVVAGWNSRDFAMFAYEQKEHDDRYKVAAEWMQYLERIWTTSEPFDFNGEFFKGKGIVSEPKPVQAPRPVIMSAGASAAGAAFAQRWADLNFIAVQDAAQIANVASASRRAAKEQFGRDILVCCGGWIICRDTEREAQEYFDYVIRQHGDRRSAEATLAEMIPNSHSIRGLARDGLLERLMAGFFGLPLIGTPQQIVERMKQAADAGIDGLAISWVDYHEGLRQYTDRIRPLMIEAGLRVN